jgi:N-acetylneuraminic acid mutarotase
VARFEAMGAVVGGELWVMGGFLSSNLDVTRRVDIYDPATDTWRAGPDLPGAQTHVGVATVGADIVLAGGFDGPYDTWSTTAAVWRWSASDATWVGGPDLPTPRSAVAAALVGTAVHVAGGLATDGNTDSGDHAVWDLAGAAAWTSAAPLANPRNHGGGAASDGLFFAIAGRHGWNEIAGDTTSVDAFDPTTGGWTARAPIPTARSEIGASTSTMPDGRILVVGGSIADIQPSADVLVYDPSIDRWTALPPLPAPRKGAVAARIGARVVVTTGSPTSTDPAATTFVGCCF